VAGGRHGRCRVTFLPVRRHTGRPHSESPDKCPRLREGNTSKAAEEGKAGNNCAPVSATSMCTPDALERLYTKKQLKKQLRKELVSQRPRACQKGRADRSENPNRLERRGRSARLGPMACRRGGPGAVDELLVVEVLQRPRHVRPTGAAPSDRRHPCRWWLCASEPFGVGCVGVRWRSLRNVRRDHRSGTRMGKCLRTSVLAPWYSASHIALWNQSVESGLPPPQPVRFRAVPVAHVNGGQHPLQMFHTHTYTVQREGVPRPSIRSWARGTGAAGLCRASNLCRSPGGGHGRETEDPWGANQSHSGVIAQNGP